MGNATSCYVGHPGLLTSELRFGDKRVAAFNGRASVKELAERLNGVMDVGKRDAEELRDAGRLDKAALPGLRIYRMEMDGIAYTGGDPDNKTKHLSYTVDMDTLEKEFGLEGLIDLMNTAWKRGALEYISDSKPATPKELEF